MVILGIDPGCNFSGFGILKKEKHKTFLLDYGCLKMSSKQPLSKRIGIFHTFFQEKIEKFDITSVSLETSFLGKNAQNFLKLGYLRGIIYLLADRYKLSLQEFSPREIKLSVTGYGAASKIQVAKAITQFFPAIKKKMPLRDDITDALAITLCGLWESKRFI